MRGRWKWLMLGVVVGAIVVAERVRPLRPRQRDPGAERLARNLTLGVIAGATTAYAAAPLVAPVQRWAERHRIGVLQRLPLPRALRAVLGFLALDYTLFVWHRMNHRWPELWRFHAVHHLDLDLDATTGLRFHFGELGLSAGLRIAQILLLGVDRVTLGVWQQLLFVSVLFHHSNVEVTPAVDQMLRQVIVTPRLHGIHHSVRGEDANTNFSSLLSWWDRLHGLYRDDVPQTAITMGVAGFLEREAVTLERSLWLPFEQGGAGEPPALPDAG